MPDSNPFCQFAVSCFACVGIERRFTGAMCAMIASIVLLICSFLLLVEDAPCTGQLRKTMFLASA